MSLTLAHVLDAMMPTIKCVAEVIDSRIDMKHLKDGTTRVVWTLKVKPKRRLTSVPSDRETPGDSSDQLQK